MARNIILAVSLLAASQVVAAVPFTVAPPAGQGMVVQRGTPLRLNGTAEPGSTVRLSLGGGTAQAVADPDGHWTAKLPAMEAATGLQLTAICGADTVKIGDVAVGEVWIASGQSNMELRLIYTEGGRTQAAKANDPLLRFMAYTPKYFTNAQAWSDSARAEVDRYEMFAEPKWEAVTPDNALQLSAIGYYFGAELRDSLNVPVGIITNAVGGSTTESWMPADTLERCFPDILANWPDNDAVQPWVRKRSLENVPDLREGRKHPYAPAYMFECAVRPLGAYPVAGVVWYQGESNAHDVEGHERMFPSMVNAWRDALDNPRLPFITVQLSSIARPLWPEFRDSQRRMAQAIDNVSMVVSYDRGDSLDVHPRQKRPIGHRAAAQALRKHYGVNVAADGPSPVVAYGATDGTVTLWTGNIQGLTTSDGTDPRTFELRDQEGNWHFCAASIQPDNTVRLTPAEPFRATAVRYGWQPYSRANMIDNDSLPTSTFMTDIIYGAPSEEGIAVGISGAYAGKIGDKLISVGGANFPTDPLGATSTKKLYAGIYAADINGLLQDGTAQWSKIGALDAPAAYGAVAETPDGLVLIGGTDDKGSLKRVVRLTVNGDGQAVVTPMPSLPVTMDNMNAAWLDGTVYVAGGNVDGKPSNAAFALDPGARSWRRLPDFPGNPRIQPAVAAADGALWLFSGFAGGDNPTLDRSVLKYDAATGSWRELTPALLDQEPDINYGGGCSVTLPDGRIMLAGGVNPTVFLNALKAPQPDYIHHPVEWYRFNPVVMLFDPATGEMTVAERNADTARAGASLVRIAPDRVIMLGGELKPRIRTPHPALLTL